ncbi:exo-alpha-sialidase [Candidatus Daviesbacteria bacterium]|nr:exo-alpha-sialidase [Candidatus Daviesbacteria bacterium]
MFVSKLFKENGSYVVKKTFNVSNINKKVNQRVPSIAIDSKDNIHLVWYGTDDPKLENNRQIKYAKSLDGGDTWSTAANVSYVDGFNGQSLWQEHPDILVGKDDTLFIVWEGKDKNTSNQQIKFSKSLDGGSSWSSWKNIKSANNSQSRPTLVQDSSGKLYVFTYSKNGLSNQQIWVTSSDDGGDSWSDWSNIANSKTDSRHVDATIDTSNNIHTTWRQYDTKTKRTKIYYSFFDGSVWSKPMAVALSKDYQYFSQIGESQGKIFITWFETTNKYEFPEEDPKEGNSYITYLDGDKFQDKFLISTNSYYPNVVPKLNQNNKTFILYSLKDKFFPIYFGEAPLNSL